MSFESLRWLVSLSFIASAMLYVLGWRQLRLWTPAVSEPVALKRSEVISERRRQLIQAGFTNPDSVRILSRTRLLFALLGAVGGAWLAATLTNGGKAQFILTMCFGVGFAALGHFTPMIYVEKRRAATKRRIAKAVPDAIDFIQVCMEAGQSVDSALIRVVTELDSMHPDLADKFRAMTDALAAGATREAAFEQLARDSDNEDLRQFANMMEQAVSMGSSLSHTLRIFATDLRDQRLRETEAKANVLPTKMTLGSMLFTVPPLLLLILSPSLIRLMELM